MTFRGLRVEDGSARFISTASSASAARAAILETDAVLEGRHEAEVPLLAVGAARVARAALPDTWEAKVIVGPWVKIIERRQLVRSESAQAFLALRAEPQRAGGATPRVRFRSAFEDGDFTLHVTANQAREIGAHLYRDVDIEAIVERDESGAIRTGWLVAFYPLDEGDAAPAWRAWFQTTAREWDDVKNIEDELARDAD